MSFVHNFFQCGFIALKINVTRLYSYSYTSLLHYVAAGLLYPFLTAEKIAPENVLKRKSQAQVGNFEIKHAERPKINQRRPD